jgi:hypothetical protein
MTNLDLILQFLKHNKLPLCDDCLSEKTGIKPRQTIYQLCSRLAKEKSVFRNSSRCSGCGKVKITNSINFNIPLDKPEPDQPDIVSHRPWYWEGNIQAKLVSFLAKEDYKITRVADTKSRESGKDIEAITPDGKILWVSVKGWPEKTPNIQGRHWFSQALFDIILYRDESKEIELALAFPDGFQTYLNLATRIKWFKETAKFKIFWISEQGSIRID